MLTHAQIWSAIDRLAARAGLSPSGLAKKAGLDPTTFNKSKRITPEGRARWPSTESVSKSLAATGATIEQFVALNVYELAKFAAEGRKAAVNDIVGRYNEIVEEFETDPSLKIELRR